MLIPTERVKALATLITICAFCVFFGSTIIPKFTESNKELKAQIQARHEEEMKIFKSLFDNRKVDTLFLSEVKDYINEGYRICEDCRHSGRYSYIALCPTHKEQAIFLNLKKKEFKK